MEFEEKIKTFMYYATKALAREGFNDFLESIGLNDDDYEEIKAFWESCGITGTYL